MQAMCVYRGARGLASSRRRRAAWPRQLQQHKRGGWRARAGRRLLHERLRALCTADGTRSREHSAATLLPHPAHSHGRVALAVQRRRQLISLRPRLDVYACRQQGQCRGTQCSARQAGQAGGRQEPGSAYQAARMRQQRARRQACSWQRRQRCRGAGRLRQQANGRSSAAPGAPGQPIHVVSKLPTPISADTRPPALTCGCFQGGLGLSQKRAGEAKL